VPRGSLEGEFHFFECGKDEFVTFNACVLIAWQVPGHFAEEARAFLMRLALLRTSQAQVIITARAESHRE
jgi:hypothetical protein